MHFKNKGKNFGARHCEARAGKKTILSEAVLFIHSFHSFPKPLIKQGY
jgi:hypothetical protein